jgi:hypothetical protein
MKKFKTFFFLLKNNFSINPKNILFLFKHALTLVLLNLETKKQFEKHYGNFNRERDLRQYRVMNPGSEGGAILGDVIYLGQSAEIGKSAVLLAGDRNDVKKIWKRYLKDAEIITAGIHEMDFYWDFELDPPQELSNTKFKLIISQATLEHLIDPYKHICDLISLLDHNGYLVVHTVLPGYFYHRVPIDCFRFYPDWFEAISKKQKVEIVDKQISVFSITYKFKKPEPTPSTLP